MDKIENLIIVEKPIVSFETAKLAKEKNIIISSNSHYDDNGKSWHRESGCRNKRKIEGKEIPAPTQVDLQKYLRDKEGIDVYVIPNNQYRHIERLYHTCIWYKDEFESELSLTHSYEESLEKGLYKALKLMNYDN